MDIKKDRIEKRKKKLTAEDRNRLHDLNEEREWMYETLSADPTDMVAARHLNEIELKIVTITGEQTMDY